MRAVVIRCKPGASRGITEACDGKVRRIDCGLSAFYGGPIQALEIQGDDVKVLKE